MSMSHSSHKINRRTSISTQALDHHLSHASWQSIPSLAYKLIFHPTYSEHPECVIFSRMLEMHDTIPFSRSAGTYASLYLILSQRERSMNASAWRQCLDPRGDARKCASPLSTPGPWISGSTIIRRNTHTTSSRDYSNIIVQLHRFPNGRPAIFVTLVDSNPITNHPTIP
jgi:hypothetical protein